MSNSTGSGGTASAKGRTSRYRAVTGATVTLRAPLGDLSEPWFGRFWLRGNHVYRAFETAPRGTFESHVEHVLGGRVIERVSVDGAQLVLAHNKKGKASLAAWCGPAHDVYTWLNGPAPDVSGLTAIFDDLTLHDDPNGVRAEPRLPAQINLHGVELKKYVPDVAFLTILDGAEAVDLVPKWSGAKAAFGEVWVKSSDGLASKEALLVHASKTSVTLVRPDIKRGVDPQIALDFLADLKVSWG